jgi:hypothetical protein
LASNQAVIHSLLHVLDNLAHGGSWKRGLSEAGWGGRLW